MANIQLARNLRFRRRVLGYTQEDVGNMLNISRQAYSNYETGARMPDLDCLVRLCEILQVTLDELVYHNLLDEVSETKGRYRKAVETDTKNVIYLSQEEVELILRFRDADGDTKKLIRKLADR